MCEVSIILPVLNAKDTLEGAIDSIVSQTHPSWELLIVDNGSVDGSLQLAQARAGRDPRIHLQIEKSKGIAHALNTGLKATRSKYIARMDADDISNPTRLQKQLAFLRQNSSIGVVSCQTKFESSLQDFGGFARFVQWQNSILTPEEHYQARFIESPIAHPTVMFRSELIHTFGPYSTDPIPEDYELWLRWMENGIRFAKLPEKLLRWNDSAERLSRTHTNYSEAAFFSVKGRYLKNWLRKHQKKHQIIACGTSKACRERLKWLSADGIEIHYLTDITRKDPSGFSFIPHEKIDDPSEWIVLNLIGKRGVREDILSYFQYKGFTLGKNLLSLI